MRAAEAEQRRRQADLLADQQAALRRVATLVARAAEPAEVFSVAVGELAHSLGVDHVTLVRFEADESCVVLAARDRPGMPRNGRAVNGFTLDGDNISARIREAGSPARIDDYATATGPIADRCTSSVCAQGQGCR